MLKDLTGQHINRLSVIGRETNNKHNRARWLCKCDCGNYKIIDAPSLLNNSTKSCGCYNLEISRKRSYEALYNKLISIAEDREMECNITYEQFVEFTAITKCYYCGDDIVWRKYNGGRYNLDRLNSDIGYTKENCVVCCKDCNYMKRSLSYSQFINKIKRIYAKHNQ